MAAIPRDVSEKLITAQRSLFERGIPAIILMEGGKSAMVDRITSEVLGTLEPRGVEYHHFKADGKRGSPFSSMEYITKSPARGRISFYDRGWYSDIIDCIRKKRCDENEKLIEVSRMERYLIENGVVIVKIFMDETEDAAEKHADSYPIIIDRDCGYLTDDLDHRDMGISDEEVEAMLSASNTVYAPWDRVDVEDFEITAENVARIITRRLEHRLQYGIIPEECPVKEQYHNPREDADLTAEAKDYDDELAEKQSELAEMQCRLARSKHSLVVVFEGWDASGKGSTIRRVAGALNPRGYNVIPVKAPTEEELSRTYLWRFCTNLPRPGRITIFDRSWYGRMMVEAVEGLCTETEYCRSADEINAFEKALVNSGATLVKIWLEISPQEQLKRFRAREEDPMKSWKITEEDWRNRSKWDVYDLYVNSMMKQTNTPWAPWTVVESEDKKYGRLKVLDTLIDSMKKALD